MTVEKKTLSWQNSAQTPPVLGTEHAVWCDRRTQLVLKGDPKQGGRLASLEKMWETLTDSFCKLHVVILVNVYAREGWFFFFFFFVHI